MRKHAATVSVLILAVGSVLLVWGALAARALSAEDVAPVGGVPTYRPVLVLFAGALLAALGIVRLLRPDDAPELESKR